MTVMREALTHGIPLLLACNKGGSNILLECPSSQRPQKYDSSCSTQRRSALLTADGSSLLAGEYNLYGLLVPQGVDGIHPRGFVGGVQTKHHPNSGRKGECKQ